MMQIYKTNFPTEQQGKDYLLNLGVILEVDDDEGKEIVFAKNTAAVVYIGKVVKIPATYDADGNILTPAVFYDGYAISDLLSFGTFEVFPADKAAHTFYGWARDAEVPPTKELKDIPTKKK